MEDKELNVSSTPLSRRVVAETGLTPNSLHDAINKLTARTLALEASRAEHEARLQRIVDESAETRDILQRLQAELTEIQNMRHQLFDEREDSLTTLNATFSNIKAKLDEAIRAHKGKDDENEIDTIKTKLEQCRSEIYAHECYTAGRLADFKATMDQKYNNLKELEEKLADLEREEDAMRGRLTQIEEEWHKVQRDLAQVQAMVEGAAAGKMRQNSLSQVASLPHNYNWENGSGKERTEFAPAKQVLLSSSSSPGTAYAHAQPQDEITSPELRHLAEACAALEENRMYLEAQQEDSSAELQCRRKMLEDLRARMRSLDDCVGEIYTQLTDLEGERQRAKETGERDIALIDEELRDIAKIIKDLKRDKYKNKEQLEKLMEMQGEREEGKAKRAHEMQRQLSDFDTQIERVRSKKECIKSDREQLMNKIRDLELELPEREEFHAMLQERCAALGHELEARRMQITMLEKEEHITSSSAFPDSEFPKNVRPMVVSDRDDNYHIEIQNALLSPSNSMREEEKTWSATEIEHATNIHRRSQFFERLSAYPSSFTSTFTSNSTDASACTDELSVHSILPITADTPVEDANRSEKELKSKENTTKEEDEWYFPPWRYVQQMKVAPAPVFEEDAKTPPEDDDDEPAGAEERGGPRRREREEEEDDEEVMGVCRTTIEDLRDNGFLFQQGDIVCVGLSHNIKGFFHHANNTLLALVAYVSCPAKDENGTGLQWRDGVCHAGFISYGGTVDTAEMAHNRSHGLESWSLLKYLELSTMPIWVIRSPMLITAPEQPHRVYTYVERSIFEAMLDRYALHSAWMKSYLPPAEADKYNFSFLLSFFSLYSDALRREIEKNPSLGSNPGEFCSVWRHVMPFGELINFPPLHSLLGGEGAYCSLSVAQFFHDCLSVHCDVDPAVRQTPSLSPFFLGLEQPINDLVKGMKLHIDDGLHFKILSPYTLEILRRLAYLEGGLSCNGALAKMAGIGTVVDVTVDWDLGLARSKMKKDKGSRRADGGGMRPHRPPNISAPPIPRQVVAPPRQVRASSRQIPPPYETSPAMHRSPSDCSSQAELSASRSIRRSPPPVIHGVSLEDYPHHPNSPTASASCTAQPQTHCGQSAPRPQRTSTSYTAQAHNLGGTAPPSRRTSACNFTADPTPRAHTLPSVEEEFDAWPSEEELQLFSENQLWELVHRKQTQLREVIKQQVTVAGVVRFQPQQINAIMAPLVDLTAQMGAYTNEYAHDRSVNGAELLRGCIVEFRRVADSCVEKAYRVNKLSAHVFASLELLLTKARNAILNEWVADLHMRAPSKSHIMLHSNNHNNLSNNRPAGYGFQDRYGVNEEENRLWEEEMLRLCVRYHAELQVHHNLDFLHFLVRHRERTVPHIPGDGGLQTSTTLARTKELVDALQRVVGERVNLLETEIDMVVRSRKDKIVYNRDVDRPFVALPEHLEAVIIRQANCATASRDSVLAEYLHVSESSGLVVIDAAEAHLDRTESVFRPSTSSPRERDSASAAPSPRAAMTSDSHPASPARIFGGKGLLLGAHDSANNGINPSCVSTTNDPHALALRVDENTGEMPRSGSFGSPKSPLARSRDTYGAMFNHQAFLVYKQHLDAKDHYQNMYSGTLRMLPAERLAIERRNRVQRANDLADTSGAKVVMYALFFYLLAVGYAYYHSYQSCFTAPFTFLSLMLTHLPAFLWSSATVLSLLLCLTLVFFQPAIHFAVILALVWDRIMWTSFLRAFALAAATIGLQMSHNMTVLRSTLRRVEWVAIASVLLLVWTLVYGAPASSTSTLTITTADATSASAITATALSVRDAASSSPIAAILTTTSTVTTTPIFPESVLSFALWLLHITCWALALATHYLPISSTMVFDHMCLALPVAYLFTTHLPLTVPTVEYLGAHTLCIIAFIVCFISAMPRTTKKKRHATAETGSTTMRFVHSAAYVTLHALSLPKSTRLAKFLLRLFGRRTSMPGGSGVAPIVVHTANPINTGNASSASPRSGNNGTDPASAKNNANGSVGTLPVTHPAATNTRRSSSSRRAAAAAKKASWELPSPPAWTLYALELFIKDWLVSSVIPRFFLFCTHATALLFATEVVLAMYYDALRCHRHSLIAIFRSIRDLRLNLDHDFRQKVVSGTVQPTVEDFNRSIMRGVERYMVLPQWLRDFAKDSAVVYPMPAHPRQENVSVYNM